MLLYGLGYGLNPAMRNNVGPLVDTTSQDPGLVIKAMTDYDKCLQAHLQARCGGARTIVEAKARCDAKTPPPTCGDGSAEGDGGEGGGGGMEPGFFAKHKTKLLIGGGLLAAYLVLRR